MSAIALPILFPVAKLRAVANNARQWPPTGGPFPKSEDVSEIRDAEGNPIMSDSSGKATQAFGIIGLEVMGRNIALNIERNGSPIAVYNRTYSKTEHFMAELKPGVNAKAANTEAELCELLEKPRRILIMVKAGKPVDAVIEQLKPNLEPGDIVIDGGNSLFTDTETAVQRARPPRALSSSAWASAAAKKARSGVRA